MKKYVLGMLGFAVLASIFGGNQVTPSGANILETTRVVITNSSQPTPTQTVTIPASVFPTPSALAHTPSAVPTVLSSPIRTIPPSIEKTPSTPSTHYYINHDQQKIPSPVEADNAPAGATAQCEDGSYSFSTHHQGTCSHHGGVEHWL